MSDPRPSRSTEGGEREGEGEDDGTKRPPLPSSPAAFHKSKRGRQDHNGCGGKRGRPSGEFAVSAAQA